MYRTITGMVPSAGQLLLEGKYVGRVELDRAGGEWEFGRFSPTEDFAPFAPLFRELVELLAARLDSVGARDETADRIAAVGRAIAALHPTVRLDTGEQFTVDQLNIGGQDIEWVRH